MPETISGREAIKTYIQERKISLTSLGIMYGESKKYMHDVLEGKNTGTRANTLVLKIIEDLKIR